MYSFKTTDYLSEDAKKIRSEVFVDEQHFKVEFDDTDNIAKHIVMYDNENPVACCRFFRGERDGEYIAGRIAVVKEQRGKYLGKKMLDEIENQVKQLGGKVISLSAQLRASGFYRASGYVQSGEIYFDEYCEHIHMEKKINDITEVF